MAKRIPKRPGSGGAAGQRGGKAPLKVIAIAGSPRRDGNSAALLKAALEGAVHAGAEVMRASGARAGSELVYLNRLTFRGCQACRPCTPDATCRIRDDLSPVLERLGQADVWLLAAPIYFDGVSGQLKLFFDRLFHLVNSGGRVKKQLTGRRAAAIIVTYEAGPSRHYRDVAGRLAGYLGWMGDFKPVEVLSCARLGPPDAAAKNARLLSRARALGRRLVERLARWTA